MPLRAQAIFVYTHVMVVCFYKLNKTSTRASIVEKAFPWKYKARSLVHEELQQFMYFIALTIHFINFKILGGGEESLVPTPLYISKAESVCVCVTVCDAVYMYIPGAHEGPHGLLV